MYTLEILATYNGRVTVLHKITRLLAAVSNLLEWYRICGIALLPNHIPGIRDVCQNVGHSTGIPLFAVPTPIHSKLVQFLGDVILSLATQIGREYAADHRGFLRHDLQIPSSQPVSIGNGGWDEQPIFHPHTDAEPHITGVAGGFHLGKRSIDLGNLFRGHLPGIDVLLFKVDGDAQPEQFPHKLDVFLCVAGEA